MVFIAASQLRRTVQSSTFRQALVAAVLYNEAERIGSLRAPRAPAQLTREHFCWSVRWHTRDFR
jgi:hypothetical protein